MTGNFLKFTISTALVFTAACATAVKEVPVSVSPSAPRDTPVATTTEEAMAKLSEVLEPCRVKALSTWPGAQTRFLAGLPPHQSLFVTTRLRDPAKHLEQVFVAVDRIAGDSITGKIWSDIALVSGYRRGQSIAIPQSAIIDWMISKPDGSEEGNLMGKFIDAYSATGKAPTGICD
jgi:hypothetical protein